MEFKIIENTKDNTDYEKIKTDYLKGVTVKEIKKKYNLSSSNWKRIIKEFKNNNIPIRKSIRKKQKKQTTGLYNVTIIQDSKLHQGFAWQYKYTKNGKTTYLKYVNLNELEKTVKNKKLKWKILDKKQAKESYQFNKDNQKLFYPTFIAENKKGFHKTTINIGGRKTTTGIYHVHKTNREHGNGWFYSYTENGINKNITNIDLNTLKKRIIEKGFDWIIIDPKLAQQSFQTNNQNIKNNYKNTNITYGGNKTGFYRVSKIKSKDCKKGYIWSYTGKDQKGKTHHIARTDINELEKIIKQKKLDWYITNKKLANKTIQENNNKS